jgi:RNase P subunit RPR2
MLPQKICCGGCDEILYHGNDLKMPGDVLQQLKGVCPKCGKTLKFDSKNIHIDASREEKTKRRT